MQIHFDATFALKRNKDTYICSECQGEQGKVYETLTLLGITQFRGIEVQI